MRATKRRNVKSDAADSHERAKDYLEWTFRRYNSGRVILPKAIAVMTVK